MATQSLPNQVAWRSRNSSVLVLKCHSSSLPIHLLSSEKMDVERLEILPGEEGGFTRNPLLSAKVPRDSVLSFILEPEAQR